MKTTILTFCLLAILLTFSTQVFAVDFTVNLTTDQQDANTGDSICDIDLSTLGEQCSLRAAVEQANALAGVDTITFTLVTPATINLTIGELFINSNITITGLGARNLTLQRSMTVGTANFRIFNINGASGTTVNINSLTIANGNVANGDGGSFDSIGGGILVRSGNSLDLSEVSIKSNTADNGGGIASVGFLNITRSTISNNIAFAGGGLRVDGITNISNSTISDNTARAIGTFSGTGGGIVIDGQANLTNVTVSNNVATNSTGGIFSSGATRLRNTIVAKNTSPNIERDTFISPTQNFSGSNNLIGVGGGGFAPGNPNANGDRVGTSEFPLDPKLGDLKNNGGQTDTRELLTGSPAIDSGNNCVETATCPSNNPTSPLTTDQRGTGFPRVVDGNGDGTAVVDIGAFEVQLAPTAAMVSLSGRVTDGRRGVANATVQLTSQDGTTQTVRTNFFGNFRFDEVAAGQMYVITVQAKRFRFNPLIINVTEDLEGINLVAQRQLLNNSN
jgi:CSLREA domain-containing protein